MKIITAASVSTDLPEWAVLQQELLSRLRAAAPEFVARYCRPDGTLIWRSAWPGMDGSDDPYEAFMYLALLYALCGDEAIYALARRVWDGITWQWTQYGQLSREFDRYYDWMHHGEGNLFLYFLGLTEPSSLVDRQRTARFAAMYTGDDPLAPNYDPETGLIRAPHTGSDGPRFVLSEEDLSTHRGVLADYPAPFEDLAGLDWTDDEDFAVILAAMNARTARGDVPVNLNATGLVTHAYLYSADPALKEWVLGYLAAWRARAERNDGVLPDNVGLSGEVGEYLGGKWWGGHYGWSWPHGMLTVIEPALNACLNAYLLTGDEDALALIRGQLDQLFERGETRDGLRYIPHKHLDAGWTDLRPASPVHAIQLWAQTQAAEDRERVERTPARPDELEVRVPSVPFAVKHHNLNAVPWYRYVTGRHPGFPEEALRANLALLEQQLGRMRSAEGDPRDWDRVGRIAGQTEGPSLQTDGYAIHAWQEFNPIAFESLIQLMWGAPAHISHGGLQFATVRYFDPVTRRPGLPAGVSALVRDLDAEGATIELVNTEGAPKRVGMQGGAFREHVIDAVEHDGQRTAVGGTDLVVELPGLAAATLRVILLRNAATPTYETMVSPKDEWPALIEPRGA